MSNKCECCLAGQIEVPFTGNKRAEIVIVGESPGNEETRARPPKPFIGQSGKLAQDCYRIAGLSWNRALIANAARCKVDTDQLTDSEIRAIMACCRDKLIRVLHHVKPKVILCLGGWAHYQVMKKKKAVKNVRGLWQWSEEFNCWVMTSFHPAYILRNKGRKPVLIEDMKLVADFKARGFIHQEETADDVKWREVKSIAGLLNGNERKIVSLDTETLGLDWKAEPPLILCYSVGIKTGRAATVRLLEECPLEEAEFVVSVKRIPEGKKKPIPTDVGVKKCSNFDTKVQELIQLCESERIQKVLQHGSFDIHFITEFVRYFAGVELTFRGWFMDTQAAAHVLDENLFTMAPLETLQTHLTDFRDDYWRIFGTKYSKDDMLSVPADELINYASGDASVTYLVAKEELKRLKKEPRLWNYYFRFVQPALEALTEMETNGVRIDQEALPIVKAQVKQEVEDLQAQALALVPEEIKALPIHAKRGLKLTRGDLLRDIFFHEDGFNVAPDGLKRTKSKEVSFDKENRQTLEERRLPKKTAKFLELYGKWQTLHTLLTRYLSGFDKHIKRDGRIHTSYSLVAAVTGRSNSHSPNMQNNPKRSDEAKKIRRLLCAESGWVLMAIDASQSELRWISHIANEPTMIRLYKQGIDIHKETASLLKGVPFESLSEKDQKEARQHAKALNFGGIYGISPYGFKNSAWLNYKVKLSDRQSEEYLTLLLDVKYPGLRRYHRKIVAECRNNGYVESPFGRRRRLPEITSTDNSARREAERQAINSPVQSASSDLVLLAASQLRKKGLLDPNEARLVAFIHDELVLEVRDDPGLINKYFWLVKHEMEHPPLHLFGFEMRLPLVCDASIGKNLAAMEAYTGNEQSSTNDRKRTRVKGTG